MDDPMEARALRLLGEIYRQNGENPEVLDNVVAEAAGLIPGTPTYDAVVIHLERVGAIEEGTDLLLPRGIRSAPSYRITPTGVRMLREAGPLP